MQNKDKNPINNQQVDSKDLEDKILAKANKLTDEKTSKNYEKLKEDLINSLAGKTDEKLPWEAQGKKDPDSWQQVIKTAEEKAYKRAQRAIDEKLAALEEKRKNLQKRESEKYKEDLAKKHKSFSRDFMELVDEGKIQIEPEIKQKLMSGKSLTQEEQDTSKGISAWKKLRDLAYENNTSVYKAYHKFYDKKPAGANAPVFGATSFAGNEKTDDYTYEDIKKLRKEYGL